MGISRAFVVLVIAGASMVASAQESPKLKESPATAYLYAWVPEIGSPEAGEHSAEQRLITAAELSRFGRFKESENILEKLESASSDERTRGTIIAVRSRIRTLQYGDAVPAVLSNARLGDVAVLQSKETPKAAPASITLTAPGLKMLERVHQAFIQAEKLAADIRRSRWTALVNGDVWQPDGRDDEGIAEFAATIHNLRFSSAIRVRPPEISEDQETIVLALTKGAFFRAEGRLPEARAALEEGLSAARRIRSARGELSFLTGLGDVLTSPFGSPETLGLDLDAEWDYQAAFYAGKKLNLYFYSNAADFPTAKGYFEDAEKIRERYFPQFEARLKYRLYSINSNATPLSDELGKLREIALHVGDIRFGAFLWGGDAGRIANRGELKRAIQLEFENGDHLGAFRILDYARAVALRQAERSGSIFPAIGSLTAASDIARQYNFLQASGDIYFTLARLYSMDGQLERSVDFSRRAIEAYEGYLETAPSHGESFAANWLFLSYLQLAENVETLGPGKIRDAMQWLEQIDQSISRQVVKIHIDSEILNFYRQRKEIMLMQRDLDSTWRDAPDCPQYLKRLDELYLKAHQKGFYTLEQQIQAWSSQCAASRTPETINGEALAANLISAWNDYQSSRTTVSLQHYATLKTDALNAIDLAVLHQQYPVVESFIGKIEPFAAANPELGISRSLLRYDQAMALCAKGSCDDAAARLEALLDDPAAGNLTSVTTILYALVEVQAKRKDALATLYALERLWRQLYTQQLARTGVSRDTPESAELDYLEKKATNFQSSITEEEKERRDFLRASHRLLSVDVPSVNLSALQAQLHALPPHTTLLVYHLTAMNPIVVRFSSDGTAFVKPLSIAPYDLVRLKLRLQEALGKQLEWKTLASDLWKALVARVGELPENETVLIAAPDAMSGLPFEVLTQLNGVPLGLNHRIVYLGRVFARNKRSWQTNGKSVVLGSTAAGESNNPSASEAEDISQLLGSKPLNGLVGSSFLASAIAHAQYIHLTIHNIVDRNNIYSSSLLTRDGMMIRAWQLFATIESPEVVVLSGCATEPEAIGILDAFSRTAAGPRWVVGAQWDLDADSAHRMSVAFYKSLVKEHTTAPAAMQAARNSIIIDGYTHPFYWAPFMIIAPDLSSVLE